MSRELIVSVNGKEKKMAIVENDRCTLMATDLELGIRLDVRGIKVEEPGDALLPTTRRFPSS